MSRLLAFLAFHKEQAIAWSAFALVLLLAPLAFHHGRSLSLLSQMGILMIFGLSFNMLLGQGGMLSFGHAVYSGLGAYFSIHAINLIDKGWLVFPITLIPLVGGLAGVLFGIAFGYLTTRRSGTAFSMITLGLVELVFACSLMFPGFFGGEGGISANRVVGKPFMGVSYGPQIEVYYLIAAWLFISACAMYAITRTPLGRLINAVRDNPERAEFIGYDAQWVRFMILVLSAFFAGVSGGLSAIQLELVTAENVSALRSGAILLFTFIGGVGFFCGPMVGVVIGVFLSVMLSDLTRAWQLYLGVFFVLAVLFAPGGAAQIVARHWRLVRHGKYRGIWRPLLRLCASALPGAAGAVALVELSYRVLLESGEGTGMHLLGVSFDAASPAAWIVASLSIAASVWTCRHARPAFDGAWHRANGEIDMTLAEPAA